jgi:methionyl-tRNA formyltransferase
MKGKPLYVVAGTKPWNRTVFRDVLRRYPGRWTYCDSPGALSRVLAGAAPRFIFFLHWSYIVPKSVTDAHPCVCFHMADVPYGRGGTPLQNLILRGHAKTKLTALRMTDVVDGGPVYMKRTLSLRGSAQEILERATLLAARMIREMIRRPPRPRPQRGEVVLFHRRKPHESAIPTLTRLRDLYDFVRMLDAPTYPRAFLVHEGMRYEFSGAKIGKDGLTADVVIRPVEEA